MPRVPGGVHCSKCDRDVLDLRHTPRKRALAILEEKRAEGRVCAWVWAKQDGTPVFQPDPSRLARFAGPAIVATALAACSPEAASHASTPVTLAHESTSGGSISGNTNGTPQTQAQTPTTVTTAPYTPPIHPASNVAVPIMMTAGDMMF
jgi:hypothetical protein